MERNDSGFFNFPSRGHRRSQLFVMEQMHEKQDEIKNLDWQTWASEVQAPLLRAVP